MKLIKPSYKIIPQEAGLEGIYKAIELAGRTCYKSENKITPTSAKEFVERMIKSGHHAMLEFGTVYMHVTVPFRKDEGGVADESSKEWKLLVKYGENPYSIVMSRGCSLINPMEGWITTNYRVIVENKWLHDLKYMCEPTKYHEKRVCVRFTTDRGISHELVRHRVFSFAQESTRYCNYSKNKFGNELTFIIPDWTDSIEDKYWMTEQREICSTTYPKMTFECMPNTPFYFLYPLLVAEQSYFNLLKCGKTPQQARQVLPNALKTEINMCGFVSDWKHFFELRASHAGAKGMHPDMDLITNKVYDEFKSKNIYE